MHFTKEQINGWIQPFPVRADNRKWRFKIISIEEAKELKTCWRIDGKNMKFGDMAYAIKKGAKFDGVQTHYIKSLSRNWAKTAKQLIVMTEKGIVYDGNHRLTATLLSGSPVEYVGIIY